jgi:hypothetical protein
MPNYHNAKIYKLWSPEGDDIYIGSTTQPYLTSRLSQHFISYKKNRRVCSSVILFEKYTDVKIELLECVGCETKDQLKSKEGEYIRNNNCVNKRIPDREKKEYNKKYREENKETLNSKQREKITCDCGIIISRSRLSKHVKTQTHLKLMKEINNIS